MRIRYRCTIKSTVTTPEHYQKCVRPLAAAVAQVSVRPRFRSQDSVATADGLLKHLVRFHLYSCCFRDALSVLRHENRPEVIFHSKCGSSDSCNCPAVHSTRDEAQRDPLRSFRAQSSFDGVVLLCHCALPEKKKLQDPSEKPSEINRLKCQVHNMRAHSEKNCDLSGSNRSRCKTVTLGCVKSRTPMLKSRC